MTCSLELITANAEFEVFRGCAAEAQTLTRDLSSLYEVATGRVLCVLSISPEQGRESYESMAQVLIHHCDEVLITSDAADGPSVRKALKHFSELLPLDFPNWVLPDRSAAVRNVLKMARKGDCVLIEANESTAQEDRESVASTLEKAEGIDARN